MPTQIPLSPIDISSDQAPILIAIPDPFLRMYVAQVLENRSVPTVEVSSAPHALTFLQANADTRILIVDASEIETHGSFSTQAKDSAQGLAVLAVCLGGEVRDDVCRMQGYDAAADARSPNDVISTIRSFVAASPLKGPSGAFQSMGAGNA